MTNKTSLKSDNSKSMVISLTCGIYSTWGGGLLIKLALENNKQRVLAIESEMVFDFHKFLQRSIVEGRYADPRKDENSTTYKKVLKHQLPLSAKDYKDINAKSTVTGLKLDVYVNKHMTVEFDLFTGSPEIYTFNVKIIFLLLDYLDTIAERGELIDLSEFKKLSLVEMEAEITNSEGYMLNNNFDYFDLPRRIAIKNYDQLLKHIDKLSTDMQDPDLISQIRTRSRVLYIEEVIRLLHNFIASCFSLVDIKRRFYEKTYDQDQWLLKYQNETKTRFADDPLSQFVQGLRNYSLHYKPLGIWTKHYLITNTGVVHLLKTNLKKFDSWNEKAKEFLDSQPEEIDLKEIINTYFDKVQDFHAWLEEEWNINHFRELREAELKRQVYHAKKSTKVVSDLRKNIQTCDKNMNNIVWLFYDVLSDEEFHDLREHENKPHYWLENAVQLAGERYFLPNDLKMDLMSLADKI